VTHEFPESDWKIFRELRDVALERFCKRVLDHAAHLCLNSATSHHESYLALCRWLQDRDDELAKAFDDPRRSRMLWQLAAIRSLGLLDSGEFARLSASTREAFESATRVFRARSDTDTSQPSPSA
jgi:hypothetical protein